MKILITGATGFIGGSIYKRLQKEPYDIRVLVRKKNAGEFDKKTKIYFGDLRNYDSVKKSVSGVDIVINCAAALPNHKLSIKEYRDINVNGVKYIVKACLASKVKKLIHISTVGIYGPTPPTGTDEAFTPNPEDIYTKTKFEGDRIVWENKAKLQSVIIRPTIAYGPGDLRPVILRLFRVIKIGINPSIGGGANYLHTVYIDNLVDAIVLAIRKRVASGSDFIIGDEKCPRMDDIIKTIAWVQRKKYLNIFVPKWLAFLVGKPIGLERTVKFVSEDRRYIIDKAKKQLGYRPKVGLMEGMKKAYEWYGQNGFL